MTVMKNAKDLPVIAGDLSSGERDESIHLIWNTSDDFDSDAPSHRPIMGYHRLIAAGNGVGHWYLPYAPESSRYLTFKTERDALNHANSL